MRDEIARGQQAGVAARVRAPDAGHAGTGAGPDPPDPRRRRAIWMPRRSGPGSTRRRQRSAWPPASTRCCCRPCGRSVCGGRSATATSCRNGWPPKPSAPGSTGAVPSPRRRPGPGRSCWPADPAICTPSAWNRRPCCCAIRAGRAGCSARGRSTVTLGDRGAGPPRSPASSWCPTWRPDDIRAVESIRAVDDLGIDVFYAGNAFSTPRSRRGVPGRYLGMGIEDACTQLTQALLPSDPEPGTAPST